MYVKKKHSIRSSTTTRSWTSTTGNLVAECPVVVDHGTLIVNEANMTITNDQGRDQKISGSYLVTYSDKISLNGTWFVNQLGSSMKKPAVSAMTVVNLPTHQNRLSLPFLHELSLSSLHHIGTLRKKTYHGCLPQLLLRPTRLLPIVLYSLARLPRSKDQKTRQPKN